MKKLSKRNRETRAVLRRLQPARLARLSLSDAAVELADEAMRLAETGSEPEAWDRSYALVDQLGNGPRQLLEQAERVMTLTLFYALTQGYTWTHIGAYLGISERDARERYEPETTRLEALLLTPYGVDDPDDPPFGYVPTGLFPVREPDEVGARLDTSVAAWRAANGEDRWDDSPERTAHPVTTGLPEQFPPQKILDALWKEEHWAWDHPEVRRDAAFMADLLETKADALQGVADEAGRGADRRRKSTRDMVTTFTASAAAARTQAAELRAAEDPPAEP